MTLHNVSRFRIIPPQPFDFDRTFVRPDHFPIPYERSQLGRRLQTMMLDGIPVGLVLEKCCGPFGQGVDVEVFSNSAIAEAALRTLKSELVWRYHLSADLSDFYSELGEDPVVGPAISACAGMRPMHPASLYEYMVIIIVLQNTTIRRTAQMLQSLFERFGTLVEFADATLFCFWSDREVAGTSESVLRGLGLGYRAKTLLRVSRTFYQGNIDEHGMRGYSNRQLASTLSTFYGIGPASVDYMMFDLFHRYDYMNHISPWEQKVYSKLLLRKSAVEPVNALLARFARWGRWQRLATYYCMQDLWWQAYKRNVSSLEDLM